MTATQKNEKMKVKKGFTLLELLIVIAILGIVSGIILVSLSAARDKARDTKRLSDIKNLQSGLELYMLANGQYPNSDNAGCGGWDTPGNGTFLGALAAAGIMPNLQDPTTNESCGNYRYYRYAAGSYSCPAAKGAFYVIVIVNMESSTGTYPGSPGWSCGTRNWSTEGEWATGKFEN